MVSRKLLAAAAAEGWTGAGGAASRAAHLMAIGVWSVLTAIGRRPESLLM